ncbi:CU044_5270 family protein [Kribbella sp. NBC_00359]|uniref:CU044_5270 family protein n=1 Tax=Kribbella sp. NBC_00359 TaxID=2975966 RepID=UPI002E1E57DF
MRTTDLDVLRRADPAAAIADGPLTEQELHSLQLIKTRIATQERLDEGPAAAKPKLPARWQGMPRRAVLVGAAVAVVAGGSLVVADPFETKRAVAATPPLLHAELAVGGSARGELLQLAARAARDVTLPGDSGSAHSVRMRSWDLSIGVDKHDQVTSAVLPRETTLVWHGDRSGMMRTTAAEPYFPDAKDRKAWERGGPRQKPGTVLGEEKWRPGEYDPMYRYPLPTDPARLLAELTTTHRIDDMGTQELVVALTDLYHETVPVPGVRSAMLSLLADRGDVVALGSMTDRAGRTGRGFAVDGDGFGLPTRQVLIVDSTTGALLAAEEVLTKTAGRLPVRVPSVIGYTLYL